MKQEYLMLAKPYKNQAVNEWFASEKLDGCRTFWDGGVSRNLLASEVPYANTSKDYRLKTPPVATGLWSRSGKVVHAPDWWLDALPKMPLDGELYLGPGRFQELRTIIGKHVPDDWSGVTYRVFDSPSWYAFGRPRDIDIRSEYSFSIPLCWRWIEKHITVQTQHSLAATMPYHIVYDYLRARCQDHCMYIEQTRLPWNDPMSVVNDLLDTFLGKGGEGVMLRKPSLIWLPERSNDLLKVKPWHDAEGVITGFTSGKGKYLGMIGALILDFNGKRLELSGLTDKERQFMDAGMCLVANAHPGRDMPHSCYGKHFKVGDTVTFKYRVLSDDGVPIEARYWRQR